jgi:hypothetical protein
LVKNFELHNFVLNIINIKKCGSVMDEYLNPKMKMRVQVFTLATYDTLAIWLRLGSLV